MSELHECMFPGKSETVPNQTSSFHQPHYSPNLDPEDGHPMSPIITEKHTDEIHNDLIKKQEQILKKLTDWTEVLAANKELVNNRLDVEEEI